MAALVVGKAVLVADALPFLRRFDNAPLIRPVLFKTIVYWAVVFVVRFLEKLGEYLFAGGTIAGIPEYVATHFTWHRFAAIQIWIFGCQPPQAWHVASVCRFRPPTGEEYRRVWPRHRLF